MSEEKRPVGRPRKELDERDWKTFETLCKCHSPEEDVAAHFSMCVDTLNTRVIERYGRNFSEIRDEMVKLGKNALRNKMMEQALDGDRVLMIWLSKQYLKMKEQHVVETEQKGVQKLVIEMGDAVAEEGEE